MYFLIPISFFFAALAVGLYIWAVRGGQYDDLDTEGQRILFDTDSQTPAAPSSQPQPPSQLQPEPLPQPDPASTDDKPAGTSP